MSDSQPYELGDLGSARPHAEVDQSYPAGPAGLTGQAGQEERVPSPSSPTYSAMRNERQRVRFNSSAANNPFPSAARSPSRERDRQLSPSGIRRPRPALSRNPNSYNSVTSDFVHDESVSPAKAKSAAEAARRAQALAADALQEEPHETAEAHHERHDSHGSIDMSGRWSPESEPVTEISYVGEAPENAAQQQFISETRPPEHSDNTTEARELLRAHWKYPATPRTSRVPGTSFHSIHRYAPFI